MNGQQTTGADGVKIAISPYVTQPKRENTDHICHPINVESGISHYPMPLHLAIEPFSGVNPKVIFSHINLEFQAFQEIKDTISQLCIDPRVRWGRFITRQ